MPETNEATLDLAINREVILHDRNRTFRLQTRRVRAADWTAYFNSFSITSEQDGDSRINVTDYDTSRKLLAESVLIGADGYGVEGNGKLTDIANWQTRIPLAHRLQLGSTLADVRVSPVGEEENYLIRAEGEEVSIDATWSSSTSEVNGVEQLGMQRFTGLKHFFRTPTAAQHKRYIQQSSRSIIVGGSRRGKTIWTGAQTTLCELYDDLIVSVEGYSLNGVALVTDVEIRREMDMHHKFTAAQELFQPASSVTTETAAA